MARVVIAPDSFKGTATASEAAAWIGEGWHVVRPKDELVRIPMADGGEGTLDAVAHSVHGAVVQRREVTGPDGRPVVARWLVLPDGLAVVELAESSGLPQMTRLDALAATTRGLGEVIAAALAGGSSAMLIGLGGSATTDGGTGALRALGMRLLDRAGGDLPDGGGALGSLAKVDVSRLTPAPAGGVRLLTDVGNPLLGPEGAAAVFGPQKGADRADRGRLEHGLQQLAAVLGGRPADPGMGAAGGAAYGFATTWGATIVPGAPELARLSGLPGAAAACDVLITGEGAFDGTSWNGKVVGHVLGLAAARTRLMLIAGSVHAAAIAQHDRPVSAFSLTELAGSAGAAHSDVRRWLRAAGSAAARNLH